MSFAVLSLLAVLPLTRALYQPGSQRVLRTVVAISFALSLLSAVAVVAQLVGISSFVTSIRMHLLPPPFLILFSSALAITRMNLWSVTAAAILGVSLLLTFSRRALFALLVGLGVAVHATGITRRIRGRGIAVCAGVGLLVTALAWHIGRRATAELPFWRFEVMGRNFQRNWIQRVWIVEDGLAAAARQPVGYGPAYILPYRVLVPEYRGGELYNRTALPDCGYVHLMVNFGVVTFLGFMGLLLRSYSAVRRAPVVGGTRAQVALRAAILGMLAYLAVANLAASDFRHFRAGFEWVTSLSLAVWYAADAKVREETLRGGAGVLPTEGEGGAA